MYKVDLDFELNENEIKDFVFNFKDKDKIKIIKIVDYGNVNTLFLESNDKDILKDFILYYFGEDFDDKEDIDFHISRIK